MQTSSVVAPGQKSDGRCGDETPETSPSALLGMDKEDVVKIIGKDIEKNAVFKSSTCPGSKDRITLERQFEVEKDKESTQPRSRDLNFVSHLHPLSNLTTSTSPSAGAKIFGTDAGSRRSPEATSMLAVSEPAAIISLVSNQLLQTAESLTRGSRSEKTAAAAQAASSTAAPSSDVSSCQDENNVVVFVEGVGAKVVGSDAEVNVDGNENRSASSCFGAAKGKATTTAGNSVSDDNSLSPSHATTDLSAASRRSSFFAEPSKGAAPALQVSSLSNSHIPFSIVSERAKQFERGIARKGAIEMKSRSLDPPYAWDPVASQAATYERLALGSPPLSAGTSGCAVAPPADQASKLNKSSKESEILSPDGLWMRRASRDRFDEEQAFEQTTMDENSMPFCTPVARTGNIQKLKSFFGETTPKIIEAKGVGRCATGDFIGETVADGVPVESKKDSHAKCDAATAAAQKSLTFDPASWALERMARGKKAAAWTLACRSHSSHLPGNHVRHKKSSTDREPSSSPKQKEHKTWKGKVAETFKRYGSGTAVTGAEVGQSEEFAGTFGVPLELLPSSLVSEFVPSFVEMCTRVVEEKGLDNQGIYRVPGNTGALNAMIEELNKDPHGLCMDSEKWLDINLVSSLLKMFFRKLPDPLITDELYEAVITANRIENSERRMLKLKKLIHDLPEHNFETLRFLAQHLNRVTSHEEVNKMDAHNLSIVFGPTLVRPRDDTMVVMVRDMSDQCRIVESLIVHCDWFFSSWDEDVYVPVDEETEDAAPISGMNQELLAKAERLAFPRLPRDIRCKELVSSFLQAANHKIRSQRKARRKSTQPSVCQEVNDDCPPKRFKRSSNGNSRGNLKRYLSEKRIAKQVKLPLIRNSRSQAVLREAPLNLIRYPISTAVDTARCHGSAETSALYRALSLERLDPTASKVSCLSEKCKRYNSATDVELCSGL